MMTPPAGRRLMNRIVANLVAVIAVTAIFALKATLDASEARTAPPPAQHAAHQEPYFTEQP